MYKFKNNFQAVLSQAVATGDGVVVVSDVAGLALGAGEHYMAVLQSAVAWEVVKITAVDGPSKTLTLTRAQEGTLASAFGVGDLVEIRLTSGTLDEFFQRSELLDEDDFSSNSATLPPSQQSTKAYIQNYGHPKAYIQDHAFQPAGMIAAWLGGYFGNGANGGFIDVLGNSVAAANAYLNPLGWYVCDGAALNRADSPIWNAAGRYLPKLTDERFLQGSTSAGNIGGSNTIAPHTHNIPAHSHGLQGTGWAALTSAAGSIYMSVGTTPSYQMTAKFAATISSDTTFGNSGLYLIGSTNFDGGGGATTQNGGAENRPQYLSCFYIIKVI